MFGYLERRLFKNIGKKVKALAIISCVIGVIISILIAGTNYVHLSIYIGLLGSIISWIGSCLMYGFGELIVKVTEIAENTKPININDKTSKQD